MNLPYSYFDYEKAYISAQQEKCKEIGIALLSCFDDKRSKELLKKLKKYKYDWSKPKDAEILTDVKV